MRKRLLLAALLLPLAAPLDAALAPGARAPDFTASGAVAGKPISVHLAAALKKGPVVLYFFPAAYTGGCNAEANAFAEALPDFTKAGATVIGMTAGNVGQLQKFSAEHCAGKFAVAAATPQVIRSYDVLLKKPGGGTMTNRTSYVIAPSGRIVYAHSDMSPAGHVRLTLEAVRKYRQSRR
jgi:peroxiredoxin